MEAKYIGFPPAVHGDYYIGVQRIENITEEMREIHALHFQETETLYLDEPFNPDYGRYIDAERRNGFVLFTVRHNSTLVGYLQYYVYRDMHASGMFTAKEDAFFLLPEHRGQGLAPKVLDFAEDFLQKLGCRYVGMSDKSPIGGVALGGFLKHRGYRDVAVYYVKELES